jgi:hypothetical protein
MRKSFDNFILFILILLVLPAFEIGGAVKKAHRRRWLPRTVLGWALVLVVITLILMGIKQTAWWQGHDQVPVGTQRVSQPSTPI